MTGEEALAIVNGALEVAGSAPLNTLEADILSGSVRNQSYPEIAGEKGYDEGHVKNTGSALCTRLSEVFGEKVTKKNVKAVLERYAKKTSAQNPGNYDILEYRDTKDKTPRPRNRPIPSDIPRQSPTFVEYGSPDQESFLAELEQALESHREVILWGMGGVGKTELALQYAQKHKANYAAQYWLSIRDKGLAAAVVELAECSIDLPEPLKGKSLEDQAAWYWQNWLPDQGNLLVILDDVPIVKNLHDRAMPRQEKVKVIVTTRDRSVNKRFVPIPLVEMPLEKAIELLTEIVGEVRIAKEPDTVSDICNKTLGCLPLALELVGEYLNDNPHFTFAKIQKKLALADQVLSQDRSQQKDYGHRGIAAALQLSWEDMSESSRNLAMLLSLFDWTNIDWSLLESVADSTELTEIDPGQLTRLHFLRPLNDDYTAYTIHTLVQAFCQDKLTEQPALNTAYRRVFVDRLLSIAKTISPKPTLAQIEF
ncbi:MAG: NB-ARC domain-containing protein, partial [Prochlorotrichaceae cyanobacterium]